MSRKENVTLKELFEETKTKVEELLEGYKHMELEGGKLYFLDRKGVLLAISYQSALDAMVVSNSDRKRYGFALIAKILNPNKVAHSYFTGLKGRRRSMKKREPGDKKENVVTIEKLKLEFEIWKNIERKRMRDEVALHSVDDETLAKMESELTMRFAEADARFALMEESYDDLEVRIVGWENGKIYPFVSYTIDKKPIHAHLSITVPTLLYYEPKRYNQNMVVAEFVKNAVHAFGDVYFMHKPKEEK